MAQRTLSTKDILAGAAKPEISTHQRRMRAKSKKKHKATPDEIATKEVTS